MGQNRIVIPFVKLPGFHVHGGMSGGHGNACSGQVGISNQVGNVEGPGT